MLTGGAEGRQETAHLEKTVPNRKQACILIADSAFLIWWMMCNEHRLQRYRRAALACLVAGILVSGQGWPADASAGAIYSYIDDKGNPVYTDKQETIPDKYRAKAKVHELSDPDSKGASVLQSVQETIKNQAKAIGSKAPSGLSGANWRNLNQDAVINYAVGAAVFLLLIMYLSKKSPMIRLLAFCLLILLGIGAPVLIYTSEGGALNVMKEKATVSGQAQQDRIRQVAQ